MAERRHVKEKDVAERYFDQFVILMRYMIVAAESKRFVTYGELTKVLGFSMEDLRDFADYMGKFCQEHGMPLLNSLIINATDGRPGEDYFTYFCKKENNWGNNISACFAYYHVPSDGDKKFGSIRGLKKKLKDFFGR